MFNNIRRQQRFESFSLAVYDKDCDVKTGRKSFLISFIDLFLNTFITCHIFTSTLATVKACHNYHALGDSFQFMSSSLDKLVETL